MHSYLGAHTQARYTHHVLMVAIPSVFGSFHSQAIKSLVLSPVLKRILYCVFSKSVVNVGCWLLVVWFCGLFVVVLVVASPMHGYAIAVSY